MEKVLTYYDHISIALDLLLMTAMVTYLRQVIIK